MAQAGEMLTGQQSSYSHTSRKGTEGGRSATVGQLVLSGNHTQKAWLRAASSRKGTEEFLAAVWKT